MLKLRIVAAAAAVLSWAALAHAGVGPTTHPDSVQSVENAEAGYLHDYSGDLGPLIDADALPPAAACAPHASTVFGILIGAKDTIFRRELPGPTNDMDLLSAALTARAETAPQIHALSGTSASRDGLKAAMLDVLAKATCGDRIFLHFGGFSATGADLLEIEQQVVTKKLTAQPDIEDTTIGVVENGVVGDLPLVSDAIDEVTAADGIDQNVLAEVTDVAGYPLLLGLNRAADGKMELFSNYDVNDFVTLVRNRGADIIVSIDSPFADAVGIGRSQEMAGDSDVWSQESDGEDESPIVELVPQHGDFLALYATVGNNASYDKQFDNPDGSSTVYGAFTFLYAQALQTDTVATARDLGDAVTDTPEEDRGRAVFRVEGSNPNMPLFTAGAQLEAATDAIHITSPETTRGPSSVQSASIDVMGIVNWTSPVTAVLVNGQPAELAANGTFKQKVALVTGANTIHVLALTQDSRLLQKSIDVVFGGDVQSLKGAGKRYAVIIGNAGYGPDTGFAQLATPIADADALTDVLTRRYGFATSATLPNGKTADFSLRDASLVAIQTALYDLSLVAGENDTVLIYYAGHGIYEPVTTTAFWVPVDAKAGAPFTYLSASAISEAIARIQAKKVVLISDSCFSGALLRGGPPDAEKIEADKRVDSLLALSRRKSRILISSGNNEPVADAGGNGHSVFAQALLNGLSNEQFDQFSARELFDDFILTAVTANSKQEPQFRPLDNVGHDGGDVIFVRAGG
jgi:hypothetical protein